MNSILLVDDEAMIRAGLRALLTMSGDYEVVGERGSAQDGIERARELRPDVVIMDVSMPGMTGIEAIALVQQAAPGTKVLMASTHETYDIVSQALTAGADGYVSKAADPDDLCTAITAILNGESYLSSRVAEALAGEVRSDESRATSAVACLTPRELEVFRLIAVGNTNKQIAASLGMSLGTAKKHRENLQRKLDCHSPAEIARLAIREGMLSV